MKLVRATLRRLWRLRRATSSLVSLTVMVGLLVGVVSMALADNASCTKVPTGVATEDYFLDFNVPPGLMPDEQFDGLPAKLQVHRVSPVYANGKCPGVSTEAAVLIHGRSVTGPVVFDLQGTDQKGNALSVQQGLAQAGIDTFAPSLLGYGKSTGFANGLDDPGNASLGPCDSNPPPPEGCDFVPLPVQAINPYYQQRDLLIPNPLAATRAHTSKVRFGRIDVWVRDIDQVIGSAIERAKPTNGKVALVGYSAGGVRVGRTLYPNNPLAGQQLQTRSKTIDKVSRVVFLNSLFFTAGPLSSTNEPAQVPGPTFPLTLNDKSTQPPGPGGVGGGSDDNWRPPANSTTDCPDRIIPGTQDQVWKQTRENDPLGSQWGPNVDQPNGGLNRAPTFSTYGWNPEVASQLKKPTLVIQGLDDGVLPTGPTTGDTIYNNLTAASNKVRVNVECASHALPWEGSDSNTWPGPHSTLKKALIEWIKSGTFNGATNGKFTVDKSGGVSGG